jgi:hypothetical protein
MISEEIAGPRDGKHDLADEDLLRHSGASKEILLKLEQKAAEKREAKREAWSTE